MLYELQGVIEIEDIFGHAILIKNPGPVAISLNDDFPAGIKPAGLDLPAGQFDAPDLLWRAIRKFVEESSSFGRSDKKASIGRKVLETFR